MNKSKQAKPHNSVINSLYRSRARKLAAASCYCISTWMTRCLNMTKTSGAAENLMYYLVCEMTDEEDHFTKMLVFVDYGGDTSQQ